MDIKYPDTPMQEVVNTLHGVEVRDPYRWLEDLDDPKVRAWIEQQNQLTRSILDSLPERDAIEKEIARLFKKESLSMPTYRNGRYFFYRRDPEQNHSVLYMSVGKFDPDDARVVIDPNGFSEDGTVALDFAYISLDGKLIAYGKSEKGSENSTLYILDVDTGRQLEDTIPNTKWTSLAWLPDNSGFYYTRNTGGDKFIPRVFFHRLGTRWEDDPMAFGDGLPETDLPGVSISRDGRYMFLYIHRGWDSNDLFIKDMRDGYGWDGWKKISEGIDAKTYATVYRDTVYILTNYEAPRYRILKAPLEDPDITNAKEIYPQQGPRTVIRGIFLAGGKLLIRLSHNTYQKMIVADTDGNEEYEIPTPTEGIIYATNETEDRPRIYYSFQSFFYPPEIHSYDLKTHEDSLIYRMKTSYNPENFEQKFVFYRSKDGTEIPLYILYPRGIKLDGTHPALLTGYGGFDVSMSPYYNEIAMFWLSHGGVYALAALRGGGEFGEEWHRAGMRENKQNVFDDFIAAAEYLIDNGYTSSERLGIMGGSNGGLLIGAAITQRPDLFRAAVCSVPLLDMVRYHKFGVAKIWVPEYGNPDDPDDFKYLYAYSPYHHVREGVVYPSVLFWTAESDGRVHPMHAMKMAARMQAVARPDRPVLLYVEPKAGHGVGKPVKKRIKSTADELIFIMWQLDMLREN